MIVAGLLPVELPDPMLEGVAVPVPAPVRVPLFKLDAVALAVLNELPVAVGAEDCVAMAEVVPACT